MADIRSTNISLVLIRNSKVHEPRKTLCIAKTFSVKTKGVRNFLCYESFVRQILVLKVINIHFNTKIYCIKLS